MNGRSDAGPTRWPSPEERVRALARSIRQRSGDRRPHTAVIAGTGRTSLTNALRRPFDVAAKDPATGDCCLLAEDSPLTIGELGDRDVVVTGPLVSPAEGTDAFEATLVIRVLRELGVERIVLTTAGAALHETPPEGSVAVVRDHLDRSGVLALWTPGGHRPALGARFPDLSAAYDRGLRSLLTDPSDEGGSPGRGGLPEVVAASIAGPHLPTPAEYVDLRRSGAEVVVAGLATAAIVARQAGLQTVALVAIVGSIPEGREAEPSPIPEIAAMAEAAATALTTAALRAC